MKKTYTSLFTCLTFLTLLITGCGKSPEQKLVGRWQQVGQAESITQFNADGTLNIEVEGPAIPALTNIQGTWEMISDNQIQMEMTVMGMTNSDTGTISFEDGDLIISMKNGQTSRFTRVE